MTIGQTIRLCRKEKDLTQSMLAEAIGVSVQAISKWETDTGMPDISQIVPLARVLEVSADKLLGLTETNAVEEHDEIAALYHKASDHKWLFDLEDTLAEELYQKATAALGRHPTHAYFAHAALEALAYLVKTGRYPESREKALADCDRLSSCISRYETDSNFLHASFYIRAEIYGKLGEQKKREEILDRIPTMFGDKTYWEAELAYAEGDYALATAKVKASFAEKARYISRCLRLMNQIDYDGENPSIERQNANGEYMLRLINAFLSGGTYMPSRQVYQKMTCIAGLIGGYVTLGNPDRALELAKELASTRDAYFDCLAHPETKDSLMFVIFEDENRCTEADVEAENYRKRNMTVDDVNTYVEIGIERLEQFPQFADGKGRKAVLGENT